MSETLNFFERKVYAVEIDLEDYSNLLDKTSKYDVLINLLFDNCKLDSWNKDKIFVTTSEIDVLLKYIEAERYEKTLKALIEKQDELQDIPCGEEDKRKCI